VKKNVDKGRQTDLLIIGSIAFDDVKTPSGEVKDSLGGSAVYAAIAASKFTASGIVGVVGDDFKQDTLSLLQDNQIDTRGVEFAKGETFHWSGVYNDLNKAETLDTRLNVFADFDPKIPVSYEEARYLFLGNIHPALQLKVLEQLKNAEIIACDTMNYWINTTPDLLDQVVRKVNIIFINEDEIKSLTGLQNVFDAGEKVLSMGPELVLIKRGEYGAVAMGRDFMFFAPVYPVRNVVDPTGAGDSFAGGFMGTIVKAGCINEKVIKEAVINGTITASFNIQDFSFKLLLTASQEEIEERKQKLIKYMGM